MWNSSSGKNPTQLGASLHRIHRSGYHGYRSRREVSATLCILGWVKITTALSLFLLASLTLPLHIFFLSFFFFFLMLFHVGVYPHFFTPLSFLFLFFSIFHIQLMKQQIAPLLRNRINSVSLLLSRSTSPCASVFSRSSDVLLRARMDAVPSQHQQTEHTGTSQAEGGAFVSWASAEPGIWGFHATVARLSWC